MPFLGGVEEVLTSWDPFSYTVGIGNPIVRQRIAETFDNAGFAPATLVHPTVTRGYGVQVGDGSVICAGVRLTTNIVLGPHVHLDLNVTVGHDSALGDYVSVNPLGSISGDCVIETGVLIGVSGVVLNGLTVGAGSTVGGCSCVVRDVPPNMVVKGVPAKVTRLDTRLISSRLRSVERLHRVHKARSCQDEARVITRVTRPRHRCAFAGVPTQVREWSAQ